MNKSVLALVVGLIIGGILFVILEGILMERFDVHDPSELNFFGLLIQLCIHAFGSFITGFFIGNLRRKKARKLSLVAALIYTSMAMITMLIDPYPVWFVLCDIVIFAPFVLMGSYVNFWGHSHDDVNSDSEQ